MFMFVCIYIFAQIDFLYSIKFYGKNVFHTFDMRSLEQQAKKKLNEKNFDSDVAQNQRPLSIQIYISMYVCMYIICII